MPITKSAIKALKQSEKKRKHNLSKKRTLKGVLKDAEKIEDMPKAQSVIDKTAKTGLIHKNKANRLKSRLAKRLSSAAKEVPKTAPRVKKTKKSS
jgi:small subunit ribosomal protein S20